LVEKNAINKFKLKILKIIDKNANNLNNKTNDIIDIA